MDLDPLSLQETIFRLNETKEVEKKVQNFYEMVETCKRLDIILTEELKTYITTVLRCLAPSRLESRRIFV
jgi:hypothetical protein